MQEVTLIHINTGDQPVGLYFPHRLTWFYIPRHHCVVMSWASYVQESLLSLVFQSIHRLWCLRCWSMSWKMSITCQAEYKFWSKMSKLAWLNATSIKYKLYPHLAGWTANICSSVPSFVLGSIWNFKGYSIVYLKLVVFAKR